MPEPPTYDHRHEEHCRAMEVYQSGLEAHWDDFETEDLELNLVLATGLDRAVILELLEARGMGSCDSPLNRMNSAQLSEHFTPMTTAQITHAMVNDSTWWSLKVWQMLAIVQSTRVMFLEHHQASCDDDLDAVDVLAAERRAKEEVGA